MTLFRDDYIVYKSSCNHMYTEYISKNAEMFKKTLC